VQRLAQRYKWASFPTRALCDTANSLSVTTCSLLHLPTFSDEVGEQAAPAFSATLEPWRATHEAVHIGDSPTRHRRC
jgi:hypothetical protein